MDLVESQNLARQFNDEEAVWRAFEQRRWLRKRLGTDIPLSEETLDSLDWMEAERAPFAPSDST
jgi:hypothetical protein